MPSRLSDAYKDHPVYLHHKYLDFDSLKELPDSYTWTTQPEDHPCPNSVSGRESTVPVIDLHRPSALDLIGHACRTWGVFQVTNHGVPERLLDSIQSAGENLFSLPVQQKLRAARLPDGIPGYGVARISPFFPKLMWSEGFTIVGSPLEHARQLWPNDHAEFCDVIEEYEKEMRKLAGTLMGLMLGSLGVCKGDIKWAGPRGDFAGSCDALQLNSYPACPDPDRAMGLAPHTDSTLLTILFQNGTSGLQVLKEGCGWVTVPPVPGALVVNVGDLLHILSNGLYPSILHRAVVNRTQHRLSVAYLYGPPSDVQVSPLPKLIDQNNPPLYRPVTWSEYLGTKAKHFDKALSSVRLCTRMNKLQDANDQVVKVG
ncbi:gibberellin 3-beta-dioxygenase 1-like [Rhodamnia argentea]|uniref:gibberellin 3beta-dioxygenase n=1 Tax=Rhodamnia argentea TaxID=178133 RepID=A0A8B8NRM3_9MYRT|nr:gibberellin 3-beta-dioxygenase 1-like [Rhodamnia argentea]